MRAARWPPAQQRAGSTLTALAARARVARVALALARHAVTRALARALGPKVGLAVGRVVVGLGGGGRASRVGEVLVLHRVAPGHIHVAGGAHVDLAVVVQVAAGRVDERAAPRAAALAAVRAQVRGIAAALVVGAAQAVPGARFGLRARVCAGAAGRAVGQSEGPAARAHARKREWRRRVESAGRHSHTTQTQRPRVPRGRGPLATSWRGFEGRETAERSVALFTASRDCAHQQHTLPLNVAMTLSVALLAALCAGVALASCPNQCSGHGT